MARRLDPSATSRRAFLAGTGALTLCLNIDPDLASAQAARKPFGPSVWLTIDTDGLVTIMSPAAEMGQGTMTTLPVIIAEELDADWSRVKIAPAPLDAKKYGNPYYNNSLAYASSMTVSAYFTPLRLAGAQARRILMLAAAERRAWSGTTRQSAVLATAKSPALPPRRRSCRRCVKAI